MNAKAAPKLIDTQDAVEGATMADLVYTWNQLKGTEIKKFENRAIAEARVKMAILGARPTHTKVGEKAPNVVTAAEKAKVEAAAPAPKAKGGLRAKLTAEAAAHPPIPRPAPRPKRESDGSRSSKVKTVRIAAAAGWSKLQANSVRSSVLERIRAAGGEPVDVDGLTESMGFEVRGYINKLLARDHIEVVEYFAPKAAAKAETEAAE